LRQRLGLDQIQKDDQTQVDWSRSSPTPPTLHSCFLTAGKFSRI